MGRQGNRQPGNPKGINAIMGGQAPIGIKPVQGTTGAGPSVNQSLGGQQFASDNFQPGQRGAVKQPGSALTDALMSKPTIQRSVLPQRPRANRPQRQARGGRNRRERY